MANVEELLTWTPEDGPKDLIYRYGWVPRRPANTHARPTTTTAVAVAAAAAIPAAATPDLAAPIPPSATSSTPSPQLVIPSASFASLLHSPSPASTPRTPPTPPHQRASSASPSPLAKHPRLSDARQRQIAQIYADQVEEDEIKAREAERLGCEAADQAAAEAERNARHAGEWRAAWAACDAEADLMEWTPMWRGRAKQLLEKHAEEARVLVEARARKESREGGVPPPDVPGSQQKPVVPKDEV